MDRSYTNLDDRQLLLLLNAKVDGVQITINELKISVGLKADLKHVEKLESSLDKKLDIEDFIDIREKVKLLEKSIASQQKWMYMVCGALVVMKVILDFAKDFVKH